MTTDDKTKDDNTISTKKLQKYHHYHQVKLINMNMLQVKKYYHLIIDEYTYPEFANNKHSWVETFITVQLL